MLRLAFLFVVVGAVLAQDVKVNVNGDDALGNGLKVMFRLYDDCAKKDGGLTGCLKARAITFFDRAARTTEIPVMDYVTLIKTGSETPTGRAMTEGDAEATLPAVNDVDRESKLDTLLLDRVARFFSTRKVQFSLPQTTGEELERSLASEGRGKNKKGSHGHGGMMNMLMMGLGMKMAGLVPIIIGKLFLLAGKALIISKIALVLSLVIALKKLLASKGGHDDHHHHHHGSHGWDKRSSDDDAQNIVYRAHVPQQ